MRELLNTLFVQTAGTVLHIDHGNVLARQDGHIVGRIPLRRLQGVVVFGRVTLTTKLLEECAMSGVGVVWMTERGRYVGTLRGRTSGNVLLRLAQYHRHDDAPARRELAKTIVAGKLLNAARGARHAAHLAGHDPRAELLRAIAADLDTARCDMLPATVDLDAVRGVEGHGSRQHFRAVRMAIRKPVEFGERSRRPPRSPFNALISFVYGLARGRLEHACDAIGLDPQVGFLHTVRPGRPSLALDLLEEHRPLLDQFCVTLVNRAQVRDASFDMQPGGAVSLNDFGRRVVINAWSTYLDREVSHRALQTTPIPFGLVYPIQALILARHLRGDLAHYLPFSLPPD